LAPPIQPFEDQLVSCVFKVVERTTIVGNPKVVEVAAQLLPNRLPQVRQLLSIAILV
jgi:hypothetical protein